MGMGSGCCRGGGGQGGTGREGSGIHNILIAFLKKIWGLLVFYVFMRKKREVFSPLHKLEGKFFHSYNMYFYLLLTT